MFLKNFFLLSFIMISSSSLLFSQSKFTEGELTMEVTEIVLSSEVGADSTAILANLDRMKSMLDAKYVFNQDVFTLVQVMEGVFGMDTTLIVHDLSSLQRYVVKSSGYLKDTLVLPSDLAPTEMEIISKKAIDEKFGLSQVEYTCLIRKQDTLILVTTEDLQLPSIAPSSQMSMGIEGTLLSMKMNMKVATLTYEVTSFLPEVTNEKYLAVDYSHMQNLGEMLLGETEVDDTKLNEDWVKALEKEYGEYKPQGINNDILIRIATEGYIGEESIKHHIESRNDVDVPSIIGILNASFGNEKKFYRQDPQSILDDFKRWGLYSPSMHIVLSDTSTWNSANVYRKVALLKLASIHDSYKTKQARQMIVDNARSIRFITNADESVDEMFINGEIGIDEWYGQFDTHSPLKKGQSNDEDEIFEIVKYMFEEAFVDQPVDLAVNLVDHDIIIEANNVQYVLAVQDFYEPDYESSYTDDEGQQFKEYVEYDVVFYNKIVKKIRQLAADNGMPAGYSIYTTEPIVSIGFGNYDYDEVAEQFPTLDTYEERLFLKKLIKKVYDPFARLNMFVPYHPEIAFGTVSTFGPGHFIDIEFDVKYVTTEKKMKFIQFQKENAESYNFDEENLDRDSTYIMNNLMEGAENLIDYLGPVKLSVDKTFSITPKSQYRKKFTEQQNDLFAAYPAIAGVLGDDFLFSNFRYDEETHKEFFIFDGKEYSIDPGASSMMRFIGQNIKKSQSRKKLFRENKFSVTEEVYYYLLPEHAKILKDLVNLPI